MEANIYNVVFEIFEAFEPKNAKRERVTYCVFAKSHDNAVGLAIEALRKSGLEGWIVDASLVTGNFKPDSEQILFNAFSTFETF